jgi:hypothetical protein
MASRKILRFYCPGLIKSQTNLSAETGVRVKQDCPALTQGSDSPEFEKSHSGQNPSVRISHGTSKTMQLSPFTGLIDNVRLTWAGSE